MILKTNLICYLHRKNLTEKLDQSDAKYIPPDV